MCINLKMYNKYKTHQLYVFNYFICDINVKNDFSENQYHNIYVYCLYKGYCVWPQNVSYVPLNKVNSVHIYIFHLMKFNTLMSHLWIKNLLPKMNIKIHVFL